MSFLARIFSSKSSPATSDAGSSSRDQLTLTEAQRKQRAAVQKMRRGVADVSVSRQRLDLQASDLQKAMNDLAAQAQASDASGDWAAAQTAMNRHLIMGEQLADLISQRDALAEQETMLIGALTQLQARVSGFNVTVETLKAAHTAAGADHAIAQALNELERD
ncbi:PspA/IM30 family protein [Arthrobacter psychrolactophilus]